MLSEPEIDANLGEMEYRVGVAGQRPGRGSFDEG